jgi:circadian clock protein KaiC
MKREEQEKASFEVAGVDDILRGGLPRGRMYLLKGRPGTGKTTLALQFLLGGAKRGERGLYVALSETLDELHQVADAHGWSLDGISLFELRPATTAGGIDEQYTMYHPAEVELTRAMEALLAEVDRVSPERLVIDSLSEIRLLAHQPLRYRRQVMAMKQHFAGRKATVLLLDDMSGGEADEHLESVVHGVLSLERHSPVYGSVRRRMEIAKLRGVPFRDGYHDCIIARGGVEVFPRLVAAEHALGYERGQAPSGVPSLDALLGGGLDRGTATLVVGPAGSGKSALTTQYAVAAAARGETCAIFTFDEGFETALARANALGMPLAEHLRSKRIRLQQIDPAEMSPGHFAHEMRRSVEHDKVRVLVIDSLNGYLNSMPEESFLLNHLHELLAYLSQKGIVTILVATQHGLVGAVTTTVDVSYLADTVLMLRYYEAAGAVRNAISVVKRRAGSHERTIREFSLGSTGITVGRPLTEFHGVLTGVPTYTGTTESLMERGGG